LLLTDENVSRHPIAQWRLTRIGQILVLEGTGSLAGPVGPVFVSQALEHLRGQKNILALVVDLSGCRMLTSPAFGFLTCCHREAKQRQLRLLLVRPSEEVGVLLRVLGVDKVFEPVKTLNEAMRRVLSPNSPLFAESGDFDAATGPR
jgi:anti-anti-sigma factor